MFSLKNFMPATVAALVFCTLPACSEKAQHNGVPVVKVNGSVITRPELDRAVKTLLAQNRVTQALPPEQMQKAKDAALDQLTSAELLYQEGSKLQVKDLDKQVEEKYEKNRAGFPSQEEYEKALKGVGMTAEEVRESMRKEIVVNNFIEKQFAAKATFTEQDAKRFYEANLDKYFRKSERISASHILVSVDLKAAAVERKKAKQKAEALLKRVQGGEDFAAVAKKESTCPSAVRGGELGVFGRGQMTPPFERAAFALKTTGELSSVVETEFGYHIIKLTQKLPATTESFEQAKEKIGAFLKREQVRQAVAAYVAQLRGKARIEKV